jgi:hypothetical protein
VCERRNSPQLQQSRHTGWAGLSSKAWKASSMFSSKASMQGFFFFFFTRSLE